MVEHALREGLASGVGAQVSGEAERLVDRQVSLDDEHGGSRDLGLLEHVATTPVQHSVDTTHGYLRALVMVSENVVSKIIFTGLCCTKISISEVYILMKHTDSHVCTGIKYNGYVIQFVGY